MNSMPSITKSVPTLALPYTAAGFGVRIAHNRPSGVSSDGKPYNVELEIIKGVWSRDQISDLIDTLSELHEHMEKA